MISCSTPRSLETDAKTEVDDSSREGGLLTWREWAAALRLLNLLSDVTPLWALGTKKLAPTANARMATATGKQNRDAISFRDALDCGAG